MTHRKNIVALDGEESLEKALTFMLEEQIQIPGFMKKILTTL